MTMGNKQSRLILFAFLAQVALALGFAKEAKAIDVSELGYEAVGAPTTVSVSTQTWTKVPAATAVLKGRSAVYVNNPATNSAAMVGVLVGPGGSTPATTIRPIEIAKGTNRYLEIGPNVSLYLMSLNTTAESVHVQEVGK